MKKTWILLLSVFVLGSALLLAPVAGFCSPHGGGGSGGSDNTPSAADQKEIDRLVQIFITEGTLQGLALDKAIRLATTVSGEGGCVSSYIAGASLMRNGEYERGRDLALPVLDRCYEASVQFWKDSEKLRTLVAGEVSLHAGGQGDYGTIITMEEKLGKDMLTDRLLVRDAKGILEGRTRLGDVLRFHKARAYTTAQMTNEAKQTLKELEFASGKVFVDGEVTGLKDAIAKLKVQVDGMARLIRSFFRAA